MKSRKLTWWIIGAVVVLMLLARILVVWTDYLWMDSVAQAPVFVRVLTTQLVLGLIIGALYFGWLLLNMRLGRRRSPEDVTLIGKRLLPEEDREQIENYADRALLVFCLIGGLFAALAAGRQALPWLLMTNAVPFDQVDPVFGKDVGFYVFQLPFWQYLYGSAMALVVVALVASVLVHLYQENIRVVGNTIHATPWARRHLLSLLALALVIKIAGYRLAQYNLLYSTGSGVFTGADYTDLYARLPVLWVMMFAALVAAVAVVLTIPRRDFKLGGWALGGLLVLSLVGGSAYPYAVQRFMVIPNELARQTPYITRNIEATRFAFGLDRTEHQLYPVGPLDAETLVKSRQTLRSIRLWDYRPLETVYDTYQTLRAYYAFPGVAVDRYEIGGELRQVSIGARQLDYSPQRMTTTWVNRHLIFTHGYGVAVSPVNQVGPDSLPVMWVSDLPPRSTVPELEVSRPQLYYKVSPVPPLIELVSTPESITIPERQQQPPGPPGPGGQAPAPPPPGRISPLAKTPPQKMHYVLVNTRQPELDYPEGAGEAGAASGNVYHHYTGPGGVQMTSFLRRLAFAVRFRDVQILLNEDITTDSRLQMHRYLPERAQAIAPFLMYDPNPYLVIADGQLKWIADAYTVSDRYPYSARADRIPGEKIHLPPVNYLRNSVKLVVDAYEGIPTFYAFDPEDPILRCFRGIFPTLFTDVGQMDAQVRRHVRYPLLQFMLQARIYGPYHVTDPTTFYNQEDWWTIPPEIYVQHRRMMEPYYVVMRLPDAAREQFVLMMPYVLYRREERVAVAWMGGVSDDPDYGRLVVYDFPKGTPVIGPMQFEALIDQHPDISAQFTLWGAAGSQIIRGNTLMIPIDGGILYVEPVFLIATEENAVPQLVGVIVGHGERVVMEPTLDAALTGLFGVDLDLDLGVAPSLPVTATPPAAPPPAVPVAEPPAGAPPAVAPPAPPAPPAPVVGAEARDLLNQALRLSAEAEQAMRAGDLATYQRKRAEQDELLSRAQQQMSP